MFVLTTWKSPGFTRPWAPLDYSTASQTMKAALQQGANLWNGGMHYGNPDANSLHLLKHYFTTHPSDADKVVLCIKGAYDRFTAQPDGSPANLRACVDECLRVLDGTKKIDIFECARVDPKVPIETSIGALAEMVNEGKIGGIGLSEVSAATIRRAHAVHPIAAVEIEMSLFSTDTLINGVVDTCRERKSIFFCRGEGFFLFYFLFFFFLFSSSFFMWFHTRNLFIFSPITAMKTDRGWIPS
jgi:pyridoxine 4-dehydrogenase